MSPRRRARTAAAAGLALAAVALAATAPASPAAVAAPCGAETVPTLTALDGRIATNIYGGELGGSETQIDLHHVTAATDLLAAVSSSDIGATLTAVKRIVYHPFWHIVRLRVLDATGALLADFGGPYVIAPVDGTLVAGGRTIGTFVMSVQDDVGFTKLEMHAVGDPIGIYVAGRLVASLGASFPKVQPIAPRLRLAGRRYALASETYNAFPTGTLTAVLAIPLPPAAAMAKPCAAVALAETQRVVLRIAARFHPLAARYTNFVETAHADTGVLVIVRIGLRVIAGSGGPGPLVIPTAGTVSYAGRTWSVFSFAPTPPARVYVLVAQPQ
ncbi:MAG TPA: hypothetical protein VID68_00475 [Solirubrobacteraceae bacterium]|jgi:hypothetical protein